MAELREALWKAADKLRGATDAAQYRDYVLGLVFLRYAMDGGRWAELAAHAGSDDIGARLDAAMDDIAAASPVLDAALPRPFGAGGVDQRRLAGLVALIAGIAVTGAPRDVLGEAYEYFLEKFARAEGRRGGEFYTPASVVRLLVEMLEPYAGQVYDPCCGSGGMFVQAEKLVLARRGGAAGSGAAGIGVYGQESNGRTWRLARMNLAIHGIAGDLGSHCADTLRVDVHPGLHADYILANPPFNMSDWAREPGDPRWAYGVPPAGNANFAWLQHIVSKLGPRGRPASCWPTGRCRPGSPARARSGRRWSRPAWCRASSPCRSGYFAPRRSPPACGSSPGARRAAAARSSSSTRGQWAPSYRAPSASCCPRTSP